MFDRFKQEIRLLQILRKIKQLIILHLINIRRLYAFYFLKTPVHYT